MHQLLTRRSFLSRIERAGLAVPALLLGCRDGTAEPTVATAPITTPTRGGTLRIGQGSDLLPEVGHPFALVAQHRTLAYACSETPVQYEHGLTPTPLLAERFELSSDRLRAVLTLKPGLEFHNGAPVTSDDVRFGIEVLQDPARQGINRALELAGFARMVSDARVTDPRTLELSFDRPRANIVDFFAQLHVAHRASYAEEGGRFVGTGPFKMKEWRKTQGFTLEAFRNWHGRKDGSPYLDAIEVTILPDQSLAPSAIQGGALDVYLAVGAPNAKVLPPEFVRVAPKIGMNYLGVNVTNPAFADARVRRAIFYAIDRARVQQVAGGNFGDVTTQPWGSSSPAFDPAREAAWFDLPKARSLLNEAGFHQQTPFAIEYPAGVATQEFQAQIIQEHLKAGGIGTELRPIEAAQFTGKHRGRGFEDLWLAGHGFADLTPVTLFEQALEFAEANVSRYESARYRAIIAELSTLDPIAARSRALYGELNQLMLDEAWVIPTGVPQVRIDLVGKRVRGWPVSPADYVLAITGKVRFDEVWLG
jgi:peptide/nickel transport system substrate-binding protein